MGGTRLGNIDNPVQADRGGEARGQCKQRLKALAAKTLYNVNPFPLMPLAALKSHAKNLPAIHQTEMTGN